MYTVTLDREFAQYRKGEYVFADKKETRAFLESLNVAQLEAVSEIMKYNKRTCKCAYFEFFN